MAKESEFFTAIKDADRVNKEADADYLKKYQLFAQEANSGKYKIQDEDK